MARVQAAQSFERHLSPVHAHALEHACQSYALASAASYERTVLRCLFLLEREPGARRRLETLGPQAFAAAPLECLVDRVPVKESVALAVEERARSEALLRELSAEAAEPLPNTGLRCTKCGSNEILQQLLQTRSADEGSTIYCHCTKCSKRWKM